MVESLSLSLAVFSTERERRQTEDPSTTTPSCQLECLRGRDGRDGRDGVRGEKGERGDTGPPGRDGEKGEQGDVGDPGPQGIPGSQGENGRRGEKGDRGVQGPAHSGGVYIRWGRTSCPQTNGTELIYSGRAGGSDGGSDFMCLPDVPHYFGSVGSVSQTVAGVEYNNHPAGLQNHNAPCAVCYSSLRPTIMMIPGAAICPSGWTTE